jgi:hypothetical protein
VSGGQRHDDHPIAGDSASTMRWFGADTDIGIGRQVYLMLSTYRESRPGDLSTQAYAALSYRF